ncbi:hypothetical protein BAE44_0000038, partial [Dichanthelium oligosanthes]
LQAANPTHQEPRAPSGRVLGAFRPQPGAELKGFPERGHRPGQGLSAGSHILQGSSKGLL